MNIEVWIALLVMIFGPAGAAWIGVKVALNGLKKEVHECKLRLEHLDNKVFEHEHRVSRLEAKHE